jgi:hypothetical protein
MRGGHAIVITRQTVWPKEERASPGFTSRILPDGRGRVNYAPRTAVASLAFVGHIVPVASTPQGPTRWARLRRDVRTVLRRGAWYRVLSLGVADAVLDVDNAPVRVARTDLEVTETRPSRWTIVARPRDAENLPASWGELYAVCPNCAARAPLGRPQGEKRCTRCEQAFEVAWDERYLKDG